MFDNGVDTGISVQFIYVPVPTGVGEHMKSSWVGWSPLEAGMTGVIQELSCVRKVSVTAYIGDVHRRLIPGLKTGECVTWIPCYCYILPCKAYSTRAKQGACRPD